MVRRFGDPVNAAGPPSRRVLGKRTMPANSEFHGSALCDQLVTGQADRRALGLPGSGE